jgi:glycosyltransferase involved in cell wall biosynthesis
MRCGAVVIGRNEGERLCLCLKSIAGTVKTIVYVDSGSADNSVEIAREFGAEVVALDMSSPFTAARARNAGFKRLQRLQPRCELVQFVDGDCELVSGWMDKAVEFLDIHLEVAAVCGRRRERYPERSTYNWLCDMEWDTPVGETKACGGDVLVRAAVFDRVGCYRADMIAGEEPELCIRLRAAGHRVWRLDAEMTLHDAAMTRLGQWWRRTQRGGYAFAQGSYLHGGPPERHWVWESRRAWLWGVWLPLACLGAGLIVGPWAWTALLIYPVQVVRQTLRNSGSARQRTVLAFFQVLSRFPEGWGEIKFTYDRLFRRQQRLIEYK